MLDIHSHIIPEVDDGSDSMKTTLQLLRVARSSGTKEIVATPHYNKGFSDITFTEVVEEVKKINVLAKNEGIDIKVYPGQEVFYDENIVSYYKDGLIGTINNSNYMLVEFSMQELDEGLFNVLYELQLLGIRIIIAHPERYHTIIKNPAYINKFIEEDFLFQMNSGSLLGHYGKDVKKTCEILLENDIYSFIGSDAHNINRSTDMSECKSILTGKYEQYINIFNENSRAIINNEEVLFLGNKISKKNKKSIFSLFKR